jgi:hypothetical protein
MASASQQTYANHIRRDPLFHFVLLPALLISWVAGVRLFVQHPRFVTFWGIVFVTAVIITALKARLYALKVQDRVIRLEEQLRLTRLLPVSQQGQIAKLSEEQLIGLRFASDEELPALAERALTEHLSSRDIKKSVKNWRPDNWRV